MKDKSKKFNQTWYRGKHCNFMPSKAELAKEEAIDKYILQGWVPKKKFIGKDDVVTAFGSCFARHVTKFIKQKGYQTGEIDPKMKNIRDSHVIHFGSGIVNTFALRQQFEWAYEDKEFNEDLWYGSKCVLAEKTEQIRKNTRDIFDDTTVFILTLGLSEVWYNKESGEVFWRAIPQDVFDEKKHGFRLSTVQENVDNLKAIVNIIRKHRPKAKIIFSLSPVPLAATFRNVSCITADSVSKSILRVALDTVLTELDYKRMYYWPSYEIVKYFCEEPYLPDNRHVSESTINTIMSVFEKHYLIPLEE